MKQIIFDTRKMEENEMRLPDYDFFLSDAVVAVGTVKRWNGKFPNYHFVGDYFKGTFLSDIYCYRERDTEDFCLFIEDGEVYMELFHHDGTNCYLLRILNDDEDEETLFDFCTDNFRKRDYPCTDNCPGRTLYGSMGFNVQEVMAMYKKELDILKTVLNEDDAIYKYHIVPESDETEKYGIGANPYCWYFCVGTKGSDDIGGMLEDTLCRLIDFGCSEDEIFAITGMKKISGPLEDCDEIISIDLGYCMLSMMDFEGLLDYESAQKEKKAYYAENYLGDRSSFIYAVSPDMALRTVIYDTGINDGWTVQEYSVQNFPESVEYNAIPRH